MKKELNFSEKFFKILDYNKTFILFFLLFSIIYILNFEDYTTTTATDYQVRYKHYGLKIIDQISNMDFSSNFLMKCAANWPCPWKTISTDFVCLFRLPETKYLPLNVNETSF